MTAVEWDIHGTGSLPPVRMRTPVYDELPRQAKLGDTATLKGEVGPPDEYYVWTGPKGWHRSVPAVSQDRSH